MERAMFLAQIRPRRSLRCVLAGLALLAAAGACADVAERRADNPQLILNTWAGRPPAVSVLLGPGADSGQRAACERALAEQGIRNAPDPAMAVLIDVSLDSKILRVSSRERGVIKQEVRPAWTVDDLCRDALALALRMLREEQARPPVAAGAPPAVPASPPVMTSPSMPPPSYPAMGAPVVAGYPSLQTAWPSPGLAPAPFAGGPPDDPWPVLNGWSGPPPQVAVLLGSRASSRQRDVCMEVVRRFGVQPLPAAPVTAQIETEYSRRESEANLLRVTTPRGVVLLAFRPGWSVDELCKDALAQALRAFQVEVRGQVAQPQSPSHL